MVYKNKLVVTIFFALMSIVTLLSYQNCSKVKFATNKKGTPPISVECTFSGAAIQMTPSSGLRPTTSIEFHVDPQFFETIEWTFKKGAATLSTSSANPISKTFSEVGDDYLAIAVLRKSESCDITLQRSFQITNNDLCPDPSGVNGPTTGFVGQAYNFSLDTDACFNGTAAWNMDYRINHVFNNSVVEYNVAATAGVVHTFNSPGFYTLQIDVTNTATGVHTVFTHEIEIEAGEGPPPPPPGTDVQVIASKTKNGQAVSSFAYATDLFFGRALNAGANAKACVAADAEDPGHPSQNLTFCDTFPKENWTNMPNGEWGLEGSIWQYNLNHTLNGHPYFVRGRYKMCFYNPTTLKTGCAEFQITGSGAPPPPGVTCTHPFTGAQVSVGTTVQGFTNGAGTCQNLCNSVTRTCLATGQFNGSVAQNCKNPTTCNDCQNRACSWTCEECSPGPAIGCRYRDEYVSPQNRLGQRCNQLGQTLSGQVTNSGGLPVVCDRWYTVCQ